MGALTPARPTGLLTSRAPCFTQPTFRALCLQPPTRSDGRFSTPAFAGAGSNPSAPSASPPQGRVWASPLCRRLARRYGRIEFLIVRMARSPPVALHPASRRRSYNRLQAGVGIPGEDLHLPDQLRSQAHDTGLRQCGLQHKQRLTPTDLSNGRSRVNPQRPEPARNRPDPDRGSAVGRRRLQHPPSARAGCRARHFGAMPAVRDRRDRRPSSISGARSPPPAPPTGSSRR